MKKSSTRPRGRREVDRGADARERTRTSANRLKHATNESSTSTRVDVRVVYSRRCNEENAHALSFFLLYVVPPRVGPVTTASTPRPTPRPPRSRRPRPCTSPRPTAVAAASPPSCRLSRTKRSRPWAGTDGTGPASRAPGFWWHHRPPVGRRRTFPYEQLSCHFCTRTI